VPASPRDKSATWRSFRALCEERGWSRAQLIWGWKNGEVRVRSVPPGNEGRIDIHDPDVEASVDIENSTVTVRDPEQAKTVRGRGIVWVDDGAETLDIAVMLAAEATADRKPTPKPKSKPKPKPKPKRKPAPKRPSDSAVEKCLDDIVRDYPNGPLGNEQWLLAEMKDRLGASPGRERVRDLLRKEKYRSWKRPVGHPRNNISAKNSAA
jgi:hypothetical protein